VLCAVQSAISTGLLSLLSGYYAGGFLIVVICLNMVTSLCEKYIQGGMFTAHTQSLLLLPIVSGGR